MSHQPATLSLPVEYMYTLPTINLLHKNDFERSVVYKFSQQFAKHSQGAKKIIFTPCHSGKLKLVFTSPDVTVTNPKSFSTSRIDFTVLLLFKFLKKHHLLVGQVKHRIH